MAECENVCENVHVRPVSGGDETIVATRQPAECENDEEVAAQGQGYRPEQAVAR